MEELFQLLEDLLPDCDFRNGGRFVTDSVLGSLDFLVMVYGIGAHYQVKFRTEDMTPANFDTPQAILALVEAYRKEQ